MPIVGIANIATKSEDDRQAASQGVHQALIEVFGIVPDDHFQRTTY